MTDGRIVLILLGNQTFANDAIVDRRISRAEVFYLEGNSYREYQRQQKTRNGK